MIEFIAEYLLLEFGHRPRPVAPSPTSAALGDFRLVLNAIQTAVGCGVCADCQTESAGWRAAPPADLGLGFGPMAPQAAKVRQRPQLPSLSATNLACKRPI